MRRPTIILGFVLLAATAATGVSASTDCQRWLKEYKESIAKANAARRLLRAKHRLQHLVKPKMVRVAKPQTTKPHPMHPRLSRAEMLRRFEVECGELPQEQLLTRMLVQPEGPSEYVSGRGLPEEMLGLDEPTDFLGLLEPVDAPSFLSTTALPPGTSGGGITIPPGFPGVGGGGGNGGGGNGGGGGTGGDTGGTPGGGGGTTPVTPVPEPESIVLMLTGLAGVAGVVRRRWVVG